MFFACYGKWGTKWTCLDIGRCIVSLEFKVLTYRVNPMIIHLSVNRVSLVFNSFFGCR